MSTPPPPQPSHTWTQRVRVAPLCRVPAADAYRTLRGLARMYDYVLAPGVLMEVCRVGSPHLQILHLPLSLQWEPQCQEGQANTFIKALAFSQLLL